MQKNLVIVESPAKAKTIEKFLGEDYKVLSSYGHIRDLKKKDFSIDVEKGFEPTYEIPSDKKKLVGELKAAAKNADMVWLASDEDREGEAISWHLYEVLELDPKRTKRIVFHEITKTAILKAIETPRDINVNLVNAQQARRILDRIVGFELSPILWKKVKPALQPTTGSKELLTVKLRYKAPDEDISKKLELPLVDNKGNNVSSDFRFAAAVAMFGQLLRDSDFKGDATYTQVIAMVKTALDNDERGYRREFLRLVETADGLKQ